MRPSLVLLGVAVLAGCGGGGGGGERLSRDAYVSKADAICTDVVRKQKSLPTPASIGAIPAYVNGALPILDTAVKELKALRPPAEMENGVSGWLKALGDTRRALEDLRSAARGGDAGKVRAAGSKGAQIDNRANSLARSLGLTACANA